MIILGTRGLAASPLPRDIVKVVGKVISSFYDGDFVQRGPMFDSSGPN